ncbi:MAG: TfpX/TfpZ family type IV pilin accessory protein [Caldimonas sp.]
MNPAAPRSRRIAAALHLLASLCVASIAALIVFGVWYPPPYSTIAGGLSLFILLMSVDVVLGPALTAVAANPAKPVKQLRRDLAIIVALQVGGLAYGLYSISLARPAYLVFEVDRMRVVTAADIDETTLPEALPEFRSLPWTGPKLIAAVRPTNPDEVLRSIDLALGGLDISMRPSRWREYASQKDAVLRVARPVTDLQKQYPAAAPELASIAAKAGKPVSALRFLPVLASHSSTVVVIDPVDASVLGFLPLEGFF